MNRKDQLKPDRYSLNRWQYMLSITYSDLLYLNNRWVLNGPEDLKRKGVCSYIRFSHILRWYFPAWCGFSGDSAYPVGSSPVEALKAFELNLVQNHWDTSHHYGAARRDLLDFLLEQIEADLQQLKAMS